MEVKPIKTKVFKENDDIIKHILSFIPKVKDKEIIVITSKIVALSQGRTASLEEKEQIIYKESKKVIKNKWVFLTLLESGWCVNAGVDESNANNKIILLPLEPNKLAFQIRKELLKKYHVKNLGIIITDTRSMPLRVGTIGKAIGYAGFEALKSYIGKKDIFNRITRRTISNIVDALASSAVIVMGEGNEKIPLAIIKEAPVKFKNQKKANSENELNIEANKDMYSDIFINEIEK